MSQSATPEQIEEGKKNYMTVCIACHQPTGMGLPGVFPSLVKSDYANGSAERLVAMVLKGVLPPFKYKDVKPDLRTRLRAEWNAPVRWPLYVIILGLVTLIVPAVRTYYRERL